MQRGIAFLILATIKLVVRVFYSREFTWIPEKDQVDFNQARLLVLLNHTSLYEPLFLSELPFRFLWLIADKIYLPIADVTLKRPLVGTFFKLMLPRVFPITRKSDDSWQNYLRSIEPDDLVIIAAEGRMKRPNGLDKHGKKMSIRGGVADIIERMDKGKMLICHSGGLHHIQKPGQLVPKVFQKIRMRVTVLNIPEYKKKFPDNPRERKIRIVEDLQARLDTGF
ncbi:MAG: 1-acyl-sn-glycerol-3-phosphate acyltransferase [Bdellovibrionales bacterium]|nr:1-acyl-sn-glycerol-3-phosphate acyltransferase [Bdellovibrionales bacterium]